MIIPEFQRKQHKICKEIMNAGFILHAIKLTCPEVTSRAKWLTLKYKGVKLLKIYKNSKYTFNMFTYFICIKNILFSFICTGTSG